MEQEISENYNRVICLEQHFENSTSKACARFSVAHFTLSKSIYRIYMHLSRKWSSIVKNILLRRIFLIKSTRKCYHENFLFTKPDSRNRTSNANCTKRAMVCLRWVMARGKRVRRGNFLSAHISWKRRFQKRVQRFCWNQIRKREGREVNVLKHII